MQGIKILCVGKIKEKYFRDGIEYYSKLIRKKVAFEIMECEDEATPDRASLAEEAKIKEKEGQRILQKIREEDYVIALCIDGKQSASIPWREHLLQCSRRVNGFLIFVIGGSLGLSDAVERRANEKLSFSAMTFPHQMMRMILCEQIAFVFSEGKMFN